MLVFKENISQVETQALNIINFCDLRIPYCVLSVSVSKCVVSKILPHAYITLQLFPAILNEIVALQFRAPWPLC